MKCSVSCVWERYAFSLSWHICEQPQEQNGANTFRTPPVAPCYSETVAPPPVQQSGNGSVCSFIVNI